MVAQWKISEEKKTMANQGSRNMGQVDGVFGKIPEKMKFFTETAPWFECLRTPIWGLTFVELVKT